MHTLTKLSSARGFLTDQKASIAGGSEAGGHASEKTTGWDPTLSSLPETPLVIKLRKCGQFPRRWVESILQWLVRSKKLAVEVLAQSAVARSPYFNDLCLRRHCLSRRTTLITEW